jgi:hypothetical protein
VELRPIAPEAAGAFVAQYHGREFPPALYACALGDAGGVRAVALVCPVDRGAVGDGRALEIVSIATHGLGYRRLYRTPASEGELGASGWG